MFLTYHREIDDLTLTTEAEHQLDMGVLGASVAKIEAEHRGLVTAIISSTGYSSRYDLHLEKADGDGMILRVDGHGQLLRARQLEAPLHQGGIYLAANRLHRNLLAGPIGSWIVGVSGLILLTNLLIGLRLAWPARGQWHGSLFPKNHSRAAVARLARHRALGLWLGPLALVTVSSGVLLVFENGVAKHLGAEGMTRPAPQQNNAIAPKVPVAQAVAAGRAVFPDADFAGVLIPTTGQGFYTVFLRQHAEFDQPEGATRVLVAAASGKVVGHFDPLQAPAADRLMSLLFPLHTGKLAGHVGRIATLLVGLWLLAMIILGMMLWQERRRIVTRP